MLKPNDFNYKADKVTAYYNDFEDYLLRDIAKFLLNADGVGGKADRELFILQQMGLSQNEITERLAQLTAQSEEAVKEVLQESVMTSFSNDKKVLDNYFSGDYGPLNNPAIRQTMDAEWAKTCGELDNLTRTTLGAYNDTVLKSLNEAEVLCASGAVSYSEAVTNVLDKLAMGGLMLDYPTGAHRSLEAAVRCAVVTSMNQTAAQVTNQYIAEGGIEYVLVSAHTGARISDKGGLYSHAEWQGRAYKIRGSEDGYPNLLEATGYDIDPSTGNGQVVNPNGLHGYNCRHSHQPWDKDLDNPWVDDQGNLKVDAEEQKYIQDKQSVIDERIARIQADENYSDKQKERLIAAEEKRRTTCKYEDMQTQRRMESQIRDTKRQIVMKDAELDNVKHDTDLFVQLMGDRRNLEHKLTNRNRVYGQYCADFGLTQQRDRLKVAGYTRKRVAENYNLSHTQFTNNTNNNSIKKITYNKHANCSEIEEFCRNTLGIPLVSFKGIDVRIANEMTESLVDALNYEPKIKDRIKFFGSAQERNKMFKADLTEYFKRYYKKNYPNLTDAECEYWGKKAASKNVPKVPSNALAMSSSGEIAGADKELEDIVKKYAGVAANANACKDYDALIKDIERDVNSKFHPEGTATVRAMFDHEFGHQLDYAYNLSKENDIITLWNDFLKHTPKERENMLSRYAYDNTSLLPIKEFIAEGYMEYKNNPTPRQIAKTIGGIIERRNKP